MKTNNKKSTEIIEEGSKRVILYTRVSTDDQAMNGYSLDHQIKALKHYCEYKKMKILTHFQEDYSAKNFNRPEWKKLEEYVQINKKIIDAILFIRWDRFSRNIEEALGKIKKFQKLGIEVVSMEQPLDLNIPDNKMMLSLYLTMPEVENDKNRIRTTEGMREGMKQGFWMGKAPRGYTNNKDADKKSVIKLNEKAPIVKEAFELISTGLYNGEEVRRIINKKGVKITRQPFINMLKNVAYTGNILVRPYKKEEASLVVGLHESIISMELFNQVQDVLNGRRKQAKVYIRKSDLLPLRGHLKCPICGGNLTGSSSTGRGGVKHTYYHCQKGCKVRFRASEANTKFIEYLSTIKISEHVKAFYMEAMRDIYEEKQGDKRKRIASKEEQIAKIRERIENIQDKLADNMLSVESFNAMKKRYEDQLTDLQCEVAEIKAMDVNFMKYMRFVLPFIENIDYFYNEAPFEIKQKILVSIFPEKLVFDNEKYRTTRMNEVIAVITRKDRGIQSTKIKKVGKNTDLSRKVPGTGIEPARPCGH